MRVLATTSPPTETDVDTIAVGLFDGEPIAHDIDGELQALVDRGEARSAPRKVAVAHAGGRRYLLVGLGPRARFDAQGALAAAAAALQRAGELGTRALCWELPHDVADTIAGALVQGTVLADYRFERYRAPTSDEARLERLLVSAHHDVGGAVELATVVAEATNAARDLQNAPGNELTPTALAARAAALAAELDGLSASAEGREAIIARGMGAFAAVTRGSAEEPRLITVRYEGAARGPLIAFVGKAVTFDSGGLSIKPAARMFDMKFDMSGGAAVLEALGAIARLRLPVRVLGVIGATENLPGGHAIKPGDIVRSLSGTTIEINNTDAEGRLVLADCITYALEQGAERIIDLATLTGSIVVALGSTHAGLMANDDAWADEVLAAAGASGERLWRLPLHPEYAEAVKGIYADLTNAPESRDAGSITAAEFLHRFVGDTPWAHLDIAGTAYDAKAPYAAKGGTGFGVRLLVELARRVAASSAA